MRVRLLGLAPLAGNAQESQRKRITRMARMLWTYAWEDLRVVVDEVALRITTTTIITITTIINLKRSIPRSAAPTDHWA